MILNFPALDFLNSKYKRVLYLINPERENSNSCKTIYLLKISWDYFLHSDFNAAISYYHFIDFNCNIL